MDINKIVSQINIIEGHYDLVDYILYNDLLYILYKYDNNIYSIKYNLDKYCIIDKIKYNNGISGCFDKNNEFIYLLTKNAELVRINPNCSSEMTKYNINVDINIINDDENDNNFKMYYINDNIYLCYLYSFEFIVYNLTKGLILTYNNIELEPAIFSFYQVKNNIYLNTVEVLYIFNIETETFSKENYDDEYGYYDEIINISKSCALLSKASLLDSDKIYDYENNTIKILEKHLNINEYINFATIDSNNLKDNIYIYNNSLLFLTYGTISEKNEDNNIILTNGIDKISISKNILIKRSLFFKNMFNDLIFENIEIIFPLYDKLNIYLQYIMTNTIDVDKIDELFDICLFIEDVDLKHLSNYIISKNSNYPSYMELSKSLNYIQLFYDNNMMKQYYRIMSDLLSGKNFDKDKFLEFLKQTQTSSDSFIFYIDTLEYIVKYKPYKYKYKI